MSKVVDKYLESLQEDNLNELDPTLMAISATSAAFGITNLAFRLYKDYFNKAARKCKDLSPREKSLCMLKAKLDSKSEQLSAIKKKQSDCSKTNNPQKCRLKLSEKVQKITAEVTQLKQRIQQLSQMRYD